ncbi:hypothetical protein WAX74_01985 [Psychrobacillus sp. FJAT-51614]|uniref:Uncharacterized protein n=1 Tax=Psychrobacillus mangrovi TaxID=3117745 RepID=A0ABU8F082_9BACI
MATRGMRPPVTDTIALFNISYEERGCPEKSFFMTFWSAPFN